MARPRKNGTDAAQEAPTTVQKFPVKLLKAYRPLTADFEVLDYADPVIRQRVAEQDIDPDILGDEPTAFRPAEGFPEKRDERGRIYECASGELAKVKRGKTIALPKEEAINVIQRRIGERADEFATS